MPRVSVIIPCYNHGIYIDEAVDSVLNQTYSDYEIIVVNDGSDDPYTVGKLEGYARSKTVVLHEQNSGMATARNYGIAHSSGEYILTLDADDRFEQTFLEKSVAILDSQSECGVVTCGVRFFGAVDGVWYPTGGGVVDFLGKNNCCGNALFRRQCWEDAGGYDPLFGQGFEDWDFWISVTSLGWRIYTIPEPLFFYRRSLNSTLSRLEIAGLRPELTRRMVEKHRKIYQQYVVEYAYQREANVLETMRELQASVSASEALLRSSSDYRLGRLLLQPYRTLKRLLRSEASHKNKH